MTLKEFKVWGRKREEKDSLYIWAKDADDAIGIARLTDQSICISQWTGNEKSYEEAIKLVKEVTGMSLDWDDANYEALQMAIKALERQPCDDVISRAEAEAIFRNARSKLNPSDYKTTDEFNTRDLMLLNAKQLIHLLPSVKPQEPKWIPVSERLPNIGETVLCQCQVNIYEVLKLTVDGWYHDNEHCYMEGFVIAWQPLPQPYKAESEDEE